jgi:antitoxin component of MazEF toxin-antitoxin module
LCRIGATDYDESVASLLYRGNTLSEKTLQDAVWALEDALRLPPTRRTQVCIRVDAGFGTDDNLRWVLHQGYQIMAKNKSGRRAGAWGAQVQDWQEVEAGSRWVGIPPKQLQFGVPTRTFILRWREQLTGRLRHAIYVVTDLQHSPPELLNQYNLRGGAEVDIRDDKQGLLLTHRRKRRWYAQEMLALLNDLAHNLLIMFRREVLPGTPMQAFGPYRLIRDLMNMPGEAIMADGRLVELRLAQSHPYAAPLADALPRLWQ